VILLGVVLLTLVSVVVIFQPLLTGRQAPLGASEGEYSDVAHRKRVALLALRDVEYDFHAGKLDEDDYRAQKAQVSAEALEALEAEAQAASVRRAGAAGGGSALSPVEEEIAEMRRSIREGAICTQCGHPNPRASRFCGECGSAVAAPGASSV
jgi:cytochrome c-type biogenesis protein CcmI